MEKRLVARLLCLCMSAATTAGSEWTTNLRAQDAGRDGPPARAHERTLRLPEVPYRYADIDLPPHFRTPAAQRFDNTPKDNPVTDAGAALGRVLFYDRRLSANGTVSCGSCHVQTHAFVDPNRFSPGFAGGRTDRHAMNLVNLRYHPRARFFWDERAGNLEEMVLLPVENSLEMGQDPGRLPTVLAGDRHYPALFAAAFGDAEITRERIARALAQFVRALVSFQSRYDEGRSAVHAIADDFPNFTREENRGKALFMRNCGLCHLPDQEAHFVMTAPANTGLDDDPRTADGGVGDITLRPAEFGQFKSPSLRNVEVAAPYMHDGRFATLEAVLDHYSSGGTQHPNKDVRVQPLNLTDSEKRALIAFLKTLTDRTFLTDPKFSDPFD
jgi:cytochrome c peroxidase